MLVSLELLECNGAKQEQGLAIFYCAICISHLSLEMYST